MSTKKKIYITCGIMLGTLITSSIAGFTIKYVVENNKTSKKDDKAQRNIKEERKINEF